MSSAALAGNISGRAGNISGAPTPVTVSKDGNISGAPGNISGLTSAILAVLSVIV